MLFRTLVTVTLVSYEAYFMDLSGVGTKKKVWYSQVCATGNAVPVSFRTKMAVWSFREPVIFGLTRLNCIRDWPNTIFFVANRTFEVYLGGKTPCGWY